jgi:hypothetical protein
MCPSSSRRSHDTCLRTGQRLQRRRGEELTCVFLADARLSLLGQQPFHHGNVLRRRLCMIPVMRPLSLKGAALFRRLTDHALCCHMSSSSPRYREPNVRPPLSASVGSVRWNACGCTFEVEAAALSARCTSASAVALQTTPSSALKHFRGPTLPGRPCLIIAAPGKV